MIAPSSLATDELPCGVSLGGVDDDVLADAFVLVARMARRIRSQCGNLPSIDLRDLEQAGYVGLLESASRFDVTRGVPFAAFATPRVRGAILDFLLCNSGLTRTALHRARDAARRSRLSRTNPLVSLEGAEQDARLDMALMLMDRPLLEDAHVRADLCDRAFALLESLPEPMRGAMRCRFVENGNLNDFAEAQGRSRAWASRLVTRGLSTLRSGLAPERPRVRGARSTPRTRAVPSRPQCGSRRAVDATVEAQAPSRHPFTARSS